jgi:hypothetical protein
MMLCLSLVAPQPHPQHVGALRAYAPHFKQSLLAVSAFHLIPTIASWLRCAKNKIARR